MRKLWTLYKERLPLKAKLIILFLLLIIIAMSVSGFYKLYDFTENDPKFCVSCHLMQDAYDAWAESKHTGINCHECHYASPAEKNRMLFSFLLHRPNDVPDRHGKVIVTWKTCMGCHWETSEEYPDASKINKSYGHAVHAFIEQVECSKCHGYVTHKFTAEGRFCLRCHENKQVHNDGMEDLACLNCHTDRTRDLRPDRAKCLYCHGTDNDRKVVVEAATIDARHDLPLPEKVAKATKIDTIDNAPMQVDCCTCHNAHSKATPDWKGCLECHQLVPITGSHQTHLQPLGLDCFSCHKPHVWKVTAAQAQETCTMCHEYREPESFLKR